MRVNEVPVQQAAAAKVTRPLGTGCGHTRLTQHSHCMHARLPVFNTCFKSLTDLSVWIQKSSSKEILITTRIGHCCRVTAYLAKHLHLVVNIGLRHWFCFMAECKQAVSKLSSAAHALTAKRCAENNKDPSKKFRVQETTQGQSTKMKIRKMPRSQTS